MPAKELREFLNSQNVAYMAIPHRAAYTAKEIAALTHISNKELAKTVIVRIDGIMAMAVLPASYDVDLVALRAAIGAKSVTLAKESEFKDRFPECDIGAMPPFGNLYGMAVYVDESLTKDKDIAFNAGSRLQWRRISSSGGTRLLNKFYYARDVSTCGESSCSCFRWSPCWP